MSGIVDNPFVVFAAFLVAQWIAAYLGDFVRSRRRPAKKDELADLDVVQTAILTLLALIVGFSFSMAVSRYDQRNVTRRRRPMRSAPNICARICCPPKTRRPFAT